MGRRGVPVITGLGAGAVLSSSALLCTSVFALVWIVLFACSVIRDEGEEARSLLKHEMVSYHNYHQTTCE